MTKAANHEGQKERAFIKNGKARMDVQAFRRVVKHTKLGLNPTSC